MKKTCLRGIDNVIGLYFPIYHGDIERDNRVERWDVARYEVFFFFRQAERPLPQIDADAIRDTHNAHERGVNMLVT